MTFFITVLRALAACLITNAHYVGIYPIEIIANGGLIGDILFFSVSGYCLCNIKLTFPRWYGKRLYRIYPPVLIITAIYMIIGAYSLNEKSISWWFVYPTYYHFVASIILLYIPFYFVMKNSVLREHLSIIMMGVLIIGIMIYLFAYDKSYYHIDNVREPMIRFLFMESMFLGAWFRKNEHRILNKFKWWYLVMMFAMLLVYFVSKILFSKGKIFISLQILNQAVIFVLLFFIFLVFAGLNGKLDKTPEKIKRLINFISSLTLEIYVVQYVLIDYIRPIGHFPINWVILTLAIVSSAFLLHMICKAFYRLCDKILKFDWNKGIIK